MLVPWGPQVSELYNLTFLMHKRGKKYRPKMILKFNVQTLTLQSKFTVTPELTQNPSRYTESSERIQKTAEASKRSLTIQTAKTSQSVSQPN